jgi:hypothetical protein
MAIKIILGELNHDPVNWIRPSEGRVDGEPFDSERMQFHVQLHHCTILMS